MDLRLLISLIKIARLRRLLYFFVVISSTKTLKFAQTWGLFTNYTVINGSSARKTIQIFLYYVSMRRPLTFIFYPTMAGRRLTISARTARVVQQKPELRDLFLLGSSSGSYLSGGVVQFIVVL